jgi:hypothetical protein
LITCERYAVTFSLSSHLTGEKSLGDPACYCHSATQEQHAVLSLAWTMENTQEPAYAQGTLATAPAGTATAAGLAGRLSESSCKRQLSTDAGSRPEACSSPRTAAGPPGGLAAVLSGELDRGHGRDRARWRRAREHAHAQIRASAILSNCSKVILLIFLELWTFFGLKKDIAVHYFLSFLVQNRPCCRNSHVLKREKQRSNDQLLS